MKLITPTDVDLALDHFVTSIQTQPVPFMVPGGAWAMRSVLTEIADACSSSDRLAVLAAFPSFPTVGRRVGRRPWTSTRFQCEETH